jgi:hypothetical protein
MVEQDDPVVLLKGGNDKTPHGLIAAVAVGEQNGFFALSRDVEVMTLSDGHKSIGKRRPEMLIIPFHVKLLAAGLTLES